MSSSLFQSNFLLFLPSVISCPPCSPPPLPHIVSFFSSPRHAVYLIGARLYGVFHPVALGSFSVCLFHSHILLLYSSSLFWSNWFFSSSSPSVPLPLRFPPFYSFFALPSPICCAVTSTSSFPDSYYRSISSLLPSFCACPSTSIPQPPNTYILSKFNTEEKRTFCANWSQTVKINTHAKVTYIAFSLSSVMWQKWARGNDLALQLLWKGAFSVRPTGTNSSELLLDKCSSSLVC